MKLLWDLLLGIIIGIPFVGWAQDLSAQSGMVWNVSLNPAIASLNYDDNVYRSVVDSGRLADTIATLEWGGDLNMNYQQLKAHFGYSLGDDQYFTYTDLNNLKNDFDFLLAMEPTDWSFYYKFDYFIRNSQYFDFDYFDVNSLLGARWDPAGPWSYEAQYENLAREYYDTDPSIWSRNFVDQTGTLSVQREWNERFSLKLSGSYSNRQFNRYAIALTGNTFSSLANLQMDNTYKVSLDAHLYFASILQDVNLTEERTDSNSYGFSNSVQSVSWAGVVSPLVGFYVQLFFRLYIKTYDQSPLNSPDLQLGFIDDYGQDLLSVKANWDLGGDWVWSLGISRIRSEADQPDTYYIKDIIMTRIRRNF